MSSQIALNDHRASGNDRSMKRFASIALALLGMTGVVHADSQIADPLHVVVSGPIDREALRASIANELGRAVAFARACPADEATTSPACLEIAIAGPRASVTYTARGRERGRLVELGSDRSQWPLVITLLAGNLVRDEAADVLAQLPDAPDVPDAPDAPVPPDEMAPPDEPAPPAPIASVVEPLPVVALPPPAREPIVERLRERAREHMLLGVGFVPGLSTDWTHVGRVSHIASIDLVAGVSGGSDLFTASGIADIERGDVHGLQVGGVVATAHDVGGIQVGGIAAVAGDLHGVQLAGTAAVADSGGIQVGGIAAYVRKDAGIQLGGVAVVAERDADVQVAGVASYAKRASWLQVAGVASVAREANLQVAGVVNVARRLDGIQLAPINVARENDGIQIGLINVGGSADGFSFGLINIVPGGRADVEAALDSERIGTLLFRHGGNRWHNVYGVAGHPVDEMNGTGDVWMYGLGFGPSWRTRSTRVDLELVGWQVNDGASHSTDISLLGQLRLSVAYGLGPIAIVAGGALNAYISDDQSAPLLVERRAPEMAMEPGVTVETWPSFFLGARI